MNLTVIMGVVIAVLLATTAAAGKWAMHQSERAATIQGQYDAFKTGVEDAGKKAEADRMKEIARQKGVNDASEKSLQTRIAAANARADRLCKSAGASAGCRSLPAVPDTTRPTDDSASDQRLLEVLRHAQGQSDTLIELQEWVRKQKPPL